MKKKNVVLIVTDDQRYDTISALGNDQIHTPNMDWLVAQGTSFTQAHIPCATSGAVCMPSRAMLHSGRTLFHLEKEGAEIPPAHTTLGQMFQSQGYDCFGTGKWHNGTQSFARSFTDGGTVFFGGMWDHWNVPMSCYDPTGEYDNEINMVMNFTRQNRVSTIHCDQIYPGVHSSTLLTDTAVDYLKQYDKDSPFFLYLAYLAPHDPRTMPEKFQKMYNPEEISLPPNCWEKHPFPFGIEEIRDEILASYPRKEKEVREHLAEYYGMISHLDEELGRVIAALKDTDTLKDTIIVFTGDNGLAVGSHGLMGKQNHYDHSVRVPLIVVDSDLEGGVQNASYVYLLDIFPTLCDMIGAPIPSSVEGESFADLVGVDELGGRKSLYFAYNDLLRSVKKDGYKLIEYRNCAEETQLFDLSKDPYETKNIANSPEQSCQQEEILEELRQILCEYRDHWEDTNHPYTHSFWNMF